MIRIDSGYFVAGAVFENGVCVRAAPFLKYMVGWSSDRCYAYAAHRGWKYSGFDETPKEA